MYSSKELEAIRQNIDRLDNQIHDLLMERADLVTSIAAEKKRQGVQTVQPAREARMIRRLMARHRAPLPAEAVVRIWRELVGAVSLLQTGLSVATFVPPQSPETWDMARDYFGSVLPMQRAATPVSALSAVREGKVNFAVLPWPQVDDEMPWWINLVRQGESDIRIIQRLPYGSRDPGTVQGRALVVAKSGFDTSDDDHSFIAVYLDSNISRTRVLDKAKEAGFAPIGLYTQRLARAEPRVWQMFEVPVYVSPDDPRLADLPSQIGDAEGRALCVGGYPSPLIYPKSVEEKET